MAEAKNEPQEAVESELKKPLDRVREQQAMQQQNREVAEERPDTSPEVPGAGKPSDIRKHPQRRLG